MTFTKSSITFDYVEKIALTINEITDNNFSVSICSICFNMSKAQLESHGANLLGFDLLLCLCHLTIPHWVDQYFGHVDVSAVSVTVVTSFLATFSYIKNFYYR